MLNLKGIWTKEMISLETSVSEAGLNTGQGCWTIGKYYN